MSTQSRVWYFHAFFVVVWPVAAVLAAAAAGLGAVWPEIGAAVWRGVGVAVVVGSGVAAFGALVGYYEEAKLLREQGADWVPRWWAWIGANLLFSPFVTAPIYLARRWQKIGLRSGD